MVSASPTPGSGGPDLPGRRQHICPRRAPAGGALIGRIFVIRHRACGGVTTLSVGSGRSKSEVDPMPATHVLVKHDGAWVMASLLHQYRLDGRWRAVIRYTVAPGMTYQLAEWCDDLRPLNDESVNRGAGTSTSSLSAE